MCILYYSFLIFIQYLFVVIRLVMFILVNKILILTSKLDSRIFKIQINSEIL